MTLSRVIYFPVLHTCSFSPEHYLYCLNQAKEQGYITAKINESPNLLNHKKVLYLRHDVDFSLDHAVHMAELEHTNGYHSTFYILMHSEHYNPLSKNNMYKIRYIQTLGHEIGWHIDTTNNLEIDECNLLSDVVGEYIQSYAQHFYSLTDKPPEYGHLINAMDIDAKYLSDSSMNWREGCLCDNLGKYDRIQCLTHPIWWFSNCANNDPFYVMLKLKNYLARQVLLDVDNYIEILQDVMKSGKYNEISNVTNYKQEQKQEIQV